MHRDANVDVDVDVDVDVAPAGGGKNERLLGGGEGGSLRRGDGGKKDGANDAAVFDIRGREGGAAPNAAHADARRRRVIMGRFRESKEWRQDT
mmetsp:Transcript_13009/g.38220  ORF Transcript_13009/g.38220 Transcript_13009/m.38220 type:complete len:93 (+) Transcript_13009:1475-1753(+)